ncbi:MAG TPA: DNA repair protein RecO [Candidatus Dojkabacteria bacterium]|nr:DNA repair protein RecO [Candidatus Dojkabacteria bacterium]
MSRDIVTVIKSVNYSEADKVLTVFGRERGKFTLFAKGIRKINSKNRGNVQTLSTSRISFFEGKGMPLLTESELVNTLDLDNLQVENVRRILYMLNKFLQEGDAYPELFDSLQNALKKELTLEATNKVRIIFLKEMGFLENFSTCRYCEGKEGISYLDKKNFALVCENCYTKYGGSPLGPLPYESTVLTETLDSYIKKIVDGI